MRKQAEFYLAGPNAVTPYANVQSYVKQKEKTAIKKHEEKTWTLAEALRQTKIVEHNGLTCRYWPDSVGGTVAHGVRPVLTAEQKVYMLPVEMLKYKVGTLRKE